MDIGNNKLFLSENYSNNKPYNMKDDNFLFETTTPSILKGTFFQDFHHRDDRDHDFDANGLCSNPMFGVQTGSNFDSFDAFPHGSSSNIELFDYETKPFANNNSNVGQVMDNFQCGGGYVMSLPQRNNSMDIVGGSSQGNQMPITAFNLQEMKPAVSFLVPDEVSCVTANNQDCYNKAGMNKSTRAMASTRKTWKSRKKNNVVKGQWTIEEDRILIQLVEQHGLRKWSHIAHMLPGRIGKQCRERWHNHLRPDIKKDTWSEEEDKVLIEAHAEIGNKWAEIAKRLPGRTENSIKNHWNATKRRQYSKRKCRSKYPRGSLLQEYIKSLNLDPSNTGRYHGKSTSVTDAAAAAKNNISEVKASTSQQPQALDLSGQNVRLVPIYNFNDDVPDFEFDEKMFQEGCSIDSLLDEIPCAPHVVDDKFGMDLVAVEDVNTTLLMHFEVKKELDLVEMISQGKM